VPDLQPAAGRVVRQVHAATGQRVIDVPPAMTTAGRVRRIAERVTGLGVIPAA